MDKYLPGGIHACSLRTLTDDTESAIVRENAGLVFASLISHHSSDGELDKRVLPTNATINWLEHLMQNYRFFDKITDSLDYFHVDELFDDQNDKPIVPCNLMRSYCVILIGLLQLKILEKNKIVNVSMEMCRLFEF